MLEKLRASRACEKSFSVFLFFTSLLSCRTTLPVSNIVGVLEVASVARLRVWVYTTTLLGEEDLLLNISVCIMYVLD